MKRSSTIRHASTIIKSCHTCHIYEPTEIKKSLLKYNNQDTDYIHLCDIDI